LIVPDVSPNFVSFLKDVDSVLAVLERIACSRIYGSVLDLASKYEQN
jgi:hypothetical protein